MKTALSTKHVEVSEVEGTLRTRLECQLNVLSTQIQSKLLRYLIYCIF